jgi:hypothetical protein
MRTTSDPLAGFKSRLETTLLATLPEQTDRQGAEPPPRPASPRSRRGHRRLVIALAGLTALAVAVIALGPALLAPKRPGAAAFAVQPSAGGKLHVTLNGSLENPEVRRELAGALREYGIDVKFLLVPGPERLVGRVLSKDHTQPLRELTYDRARLGPGGEQVPGVVNVNLYIAVGVRGHGPAVEVAP